MPIDIINAFDNKNRNTHNNNNNNKHDNAICNTRCVVAHNTLCNI